MFYNTYIRLHEEDNKLNFNNENITDNQIEGEEELVTENRKKGSRLKILIIIGVILASVLLGVISFIFNRNILGSWAIVSPNGPAAVLSFKSDGNLYVSMGSLTQGGGSYIIKDNKNMQLAVGLEGLTTLTDARYNISGNIITGKTLTIEFDKTQLTLVPVKSSVTLPDSKNFEVHPDLLGTWSDSTGMLRYTFRDDGVYLMEKVADGSELLFSITGTYSINDNKMDRVFLVSSTGESKTMSGEFSIKDNILTIDNMYLYKNK